MGELTWWCFSAGRFSIPKHGYIIITETFDSSKELKEPAITCDQIAPKDVE